MFGLHTSPGSSDEDESSKKAYNSNETKATRAISTKNRISQNQAVVHPLPRGLPRSPAMMNLSTILLPYFTFERPNSAFSEHPISYPHSSNNSRSLISDENNENNTTSQDRWSSVEWHELTSLDTATRAVLESKLSKKDNSERLAPRLICVASYAYGWQE